MVMGLTYLSDVEPEKFLRHWLCGMRESGQVGWPLVQEIN